MSQRKFFVIDTSVLLYDMKSIHSFPENDLIIPLIVLDELDRFKESPGLLGESARYINRFLDSLRSQGNLSDGINIEETGQSIRVVLGAADMQSIKGLDWSYGDNKIIACSLYLKEQNKDQIVKVITKDINLRVKCDALGLEAEDYFKDDLEFDSDYDGWEEIELSQEKIEKFYEDGECEIESSNLFENQFVVGTNGKQSLLAIHKNGFIYSLKRSIDKSIKLVPRNKEQKFAVEALMDDDIPLVTLTGLAGSGKTFLSLMAAIEGIHSGKYDRIVFTRSLQPVGKEIGYLPGDIGEKMAPWLAPIVDNIRHAFKDTTYFDMMLSKGKIEVAPLSFIRGRTFPNCFILVDESQNASIHELKTIVTRVGEDSKIVLLGDTDQIDTPYITKKSNGLSIITEKFKSSKLQAHVHLPRGQRSNLATEAARLL
jgi:PhoH-like ATPase